MFDTLLIAERMQGMTLAQAWAWYIHYHSFPRPLRVLEWWLAAKAFGTWVGGYELVNVLATGVSAFAVVAIAFSMGFGPKRAFAIAVAFGLAYPMGYATLHYPFALNLALGLGGLALVLRDYWWGAGLIILAALGHEVNLLFCVLPMVYHLTTRRLGDAAWYPLIGVFAWVTVGGLTGVETAPHVYEMPVLDHLARVLVPALTGGLAVESFRFLGPPYASVRAFFHTPWALLFAVCALPTLAAFWAGRDAFLWLWVALGVGALLLPVGTPESYHLLVVLPALFMLWARLSWRWVPVLAVVLALFLVARVNLAGDVAEMKRHVAMMRDNHKLKPDAVRVVRYEHMPLLVGGHWAYLPAMELGGACLVEPVWLWRRGQYLNDHEAIRQGAKLLSHPTMGIVRDGRLTVCGG